MERMKKLGLLVKEISGNRIKTQAQDANSIFVIKYSGLSSPDLSLLRQSLKTVNATLFVVRNNVAKRALKDLGHQELGNTIEEPCGFIFMREEPVGASRVLCDFIKDHEQLKLGGGLFNQKLLSEKDIRVLAKLPSKEVLRAQVVMGLKSPITGLVMVLHQTLRKFVYCLDQIKNKKGGQ